jgi:WS/DGAT C-terminal domain
MGRAGAGRRRVQRRALHRFVREGPFIKAVLEDYDDAARAAGCALLPAFGYDYVPGNLAGALAAREGGASATSLDIAYFATGSLTRGLSSGTQATMAAGLHVPTFVLREGTVGTERTARSVRRFRVGDRQRSAFSVSGSEIFLLHDHLPTIRDITVYNGWFPSMSRVFRMESVYPVSIPFEGQGLNMTVLSSAGSMHFGIIGCRSNVSHLQRLLDYLEDSLAELETA